MMSAFVFPPVGYPIPSSRASSASSGFTTPSPPNSGGSADGGYTCNRGGDRLYAPQARIPFGAGPAVFCSTNRAIPEVICRKGPLLAVHPPIPPPGQQTFPRLAALAPMSGFNPVEVCVRRMERCEEELRQLIILTDRARKQRGFNAAWEASKVNRAKGNMGGTDLGSAVISRRTYGSDSLFQQKNEYHFFFERLQKQRDDLRGLLTSSHLLQLRPLMPLLDRAMRRFQDTWAIERQLQHRARVVGERPASRPEVLHVHKQMAEVMLQMQEALLRINTMMSRI